MGIPVPRLFLEFDLKESFFNSNIFNAVGKAFPETAFIAKFADQVNVFKSTQPS